MDFLASARSAGVFYPEQSGGFILGTSQTADGERRSGQKQVRWIPFSYVVPMLQPMGLSLVAVTAAATAMPMAGISSFPFQKKMK